MFSWFNWTILSLREAVKVVDQCGGLFGWQSIAQQYWMALWKNNNLSIPTLNLRGKWFNYIALFINSWKGSNKQFINKKYKHNEAYIEQCQHATERESQHWSTSTMRLDPRMNSNPKLIEPELIFFTLGLTCANCKGSNKGKNRNRCKNFHQITIHSSRADRQWITVEPTEVNNQ